MDTADRGNASTGAGEFTRHSVKALAAQHATLLRQARDSGADLSQTKSKQQAQLEAHVAGFADDERRRFTELYAEEMSASTDKLLAEAIEQSEKRAIREYPRDGSADRAATWFFIILILVFLAIASKT